VDVEAQPALGGVVCDSRVDGNWRSVVRKSTKGTERGYAAGELYGDVYSHGERSDYKYGADSVHGAIDSAGARARFWCQTGVMLKRCASNASRRTKRPMVRSSWPARE